MIRAKKLRKALIDSDMSIKLLAEKTGVTDRQVRRIINGYSNGSVAWWKRAAEVLNVNISDIIED